MHQRRRPLFHAPGLPATCGTDPGATPGTPKRLCVQQPRYGVGKRVSRGDLENGRLQFRSGPFAVRCWSTPLVHGRPTPGLLRLRLRTPKDARAAWASYLQGRPCPDLSVVVRCGPRGQRPIFQGVQCAARTSGVRSSESRARCSESGVRSREFGVGSSELGTLPLGALAHRYCDVSWASLPPFRKGDRGGFVGLSTGSPLPNREST